MSTWIPGQRLQFEPRIIGTAGIQVVQGTGVINVNRTEVRGTKTYPVQPLPDQEVGEWYRKNKLNVQQIAWEAVQVAYPFDGPPVSASNSSSTSASNSTSSSNSASESPSSSASSSVSPSVPPSSSASVSASISTSPSPSPSVSPSNSVSIPPSSSSSISTSISPSASISPSPSF